MKSPVPVIMYHTVGVPNKAWQWHHLTIPVNIFENQLKTLLRYGYKTITLAELHDYVFHSKPIPKKSVVLTFDDGYLDNWLFAFPLLKKYNMKGTIYVNPEFMDTRNIVRKRYDEDPSIINNKNHFGFLSWQEMKEMEESGHIDIQSHAMSHTWYETSNKIIDFRHPGDPYIWLTWNNNKDKKPFLHIDNSDLVRLGEPVYEHDKSLGAQRVFPDKNVSDTIVNYVKEHGGKSFFGKDNWREILTKQVEELTKSAAASIVETKKEQLARFEYELSESKRIIEQKLNKKVDFFCWPGGGACDEAAQIVRKHYKSSTAARDIAKIRKTIYNTPDNKIDRVERLSPDIYWNSKTGDTAIIKYARGISFIMLLSKFKIKQKFNHARIYVRLMKMFYNFKYKIT